MIRNPNILACWADHLNESNMADGSRKTDGDCENQGWHPGSSVSPEESAVPEELVIPTARAAAHGIQTGQSG